MAFITEEPEEEVIQESPEPKSKKPMKPKPMMQKPRSSSSNQGTTSVEPPTANVFMFWAYFTLAVSIITLFFVFLSSLTPQDDKSWFLSLPKDLRSHYSKGRTVKVHLSPNRSPIEVFSIEDGPKNGETVVLVHGLGCSSYSFRHVIRSLGLNGIHAVGIDLPGSGFSDKTSLEEDERWGGPFGGIWDIYSEIKEKGLFWGFDHLVETGNIPYDEYQVRVSTSKSVKPLELNSEEMGRVIGQVIDTLGLSPVHLVLHDSALGMSANWVAENSGSVSSLTLIDSSSSSMALPLWVLQVPVVRELVLGFSSMYVGVLQLCCSKSIDVSVAEAHRVLLKGRDGRRAVVGTGRGLNCSFDIGEWASSEGVKGVPVQVLWSRSWSEEWSKEGRRVADALQQAKFIMHSGGRWPQEDAAEEITESITRFVSSLPKTVKQVVEEPLPEHMKKMFEEGEGSDHHHGHGHDHGSHGHDHGSHGHDHAAGYMDAYGLGHGWGS